MSKGIDKAHVKHIAKLSRLEMTEEEVERFSEQLSSIVGYIEKLNELETESVEPLAHCLEIHNVFREDVVKESFGVESALSNAPQRVNGYFKVPKILDDGLSA
jgi:aspartyl-tRNA(Asn)/glutamyl-tRNA(Gln) amidotransferase subunit C